MRALVLNHDKKPLMPCDMHRAHELLHNKRAAIYRHVPFTIILKKRLDNPVLQPVELKIDPGSKTTGIALVANETVVIGINLEHRGEAIKAALAARHALRHTRRARTTRYREPRFDNRTRPAGWLPPSITSRVNNVLTWSKQLAAFAPVTDIAVENVKFDMQKMENPDVSGVEYQQGELAGYEVREYLLEKFGRTCAYCDAKNVPLEVEHVTPRSRGGSNRVSNLTLACHKCNQAKATLDVREFVKDRSRLAHILAILKVPLKDAAAVNTTRKAIVKSLATLGLPITLGTGARTKMNRVAQGYEKDHWIDAACVGESGARVHIVDLDALKIKAMGRGTRQVRRSNAYGFPRGAAKTAKRRDGFQTGDLVRAAISKGKAPGTHVGRILAAGAKRFDVGTRHGTIGTTAQNLVLLQKDFGYALVA